VKEALLYQKLANKSVKCLVCNHYCIIKNGEKGKCRVRENVDGILYTLNYGKTIAIGNDPIEKKPIYHYLPHTRSYSLATVGCNFTCKWCQNYDISQYPQTHDDIIGEMITPEAHVEAAVKEKCKSIAYTYSEPTIFLEYAYDIMKLAHKHGLKNIWVTNGYMSKETLELILPFLDAINIDLKGFDDKIMFKYCGGLVKPVKDNIIRVYNSHVHLEITTLVVPGVNDSLEELRKIAEFISSCLSNDVPWHVTRFYPAWKMSNIDPTNIEILKQAKTIGEKIGLKHVHIGNI